VTTYAPWFSSETLALYKSLTYLLTCSSRRHYELRPTQLLYSWLSALCLLVMTIIVVLVIILVTIISLALCNAGSLANLNFEGWNRSHTTKKLHVQSCRCLLQKLQKWVIFWVSYRAFADRRGYLIMNLSRITTWRTWSLQLSETNNIMYAVKTLYLAVWILRGFPAGNRLLVVEHTQHLIVEYTSATYKRRRCVGRMTSWWTSSHVVVNRLFIRPYANGI